MTWLPFSLLQAAGRADALSLTAVAAVSWHCFIDDVERGAIRWMLGVLWRFERSG